MDTMNRPLHPGENRVLRDPEKRPATPRKMSKTERRRLMADVLDATRAQWTETKDSGPSTRSKTTP